MKQQKYALAVLLMFALAGIIYNSWPIGYIVDPSTARYGLISDLDLPGHPYYWIFLLGDCLVAIILIAAGLIIKLKLKPEFKSRSLNLAVVGLLVFGVFTATSSLSSNSCPPAHFCATFGKTTFGPDGVESTLSALGLLFSLITVNFFSIRKRLSSSYRQLSALALLAWPASAAWFLVESAKNVPTIHISQETFLVVTGLALVVVGLDIYYATKTSHPQNRPHTAVKSKSSPS